VAELIQYLKDNKKTTRWMMLALIPLVLLYTQYSEKTESVKTGLEIKLTFENSAGLNFVYLKELTVGEAHVIDSLDIRRENKAVFIPEVKEPGFYLVQTDKQEPIVLLVEPNEQIDIVIHGKENQSYEVSGSPGSSLLRDYRLLLKKGPRQIDSLRTIFNAAVNTGQYAVVRAGLDTAFQRVLETQQGYARTFVKAHLQSLASLYVINQRLGPQRLLNMEKDYALFNSLDSAIMQKYPANKHALDHHKRITDTKRKLAERQIAKEYGSQTQKQPQ